MVPIKAVMTPATRQFLPAVERADWMTALQVLDDHWIEIWFAVDPTDLHRVVAQAPAYLLATHPSASYVARATGFGPVEDLLEPEAAPGRGASPMQIAQHISDMRLRGFPARAMTYVRRGEGLVGAQRGQLLDGSGGTTAMWLVQAGITALLAGEAATAKGMLLTATDTHRPDRFPFVVREATAKLALAHAVTGHLPEAAAVNEQARRLPRTESWVESMVDDTIWLTDYVCAVDALDPRAEELRQVKASPMGLREFWPLALTAQVRHLLLTGRAHQAEALCDAVAAAGLPPEGADGCFATAVSDARLAIHSGRGRTGDRDRRPARSAQAELTHTVGLFVTGQFQHVIELAELPATFDARLLRAAALVRAQALTAVEQPAGRALLLATLEEILGQRTWGTLAFLTRETLDSVRDTATGARAADLIEQSGLPNLEVLALLEAPLSGAEVAVLQLLQEGLTRDDMARRLFLSVNTIKSQLRSAYRKLGVARRDEAVTKASLLGL